MNHIGNDSIRSIPKLQATVSVTRKEEHKFCTQFKRGERVSSSRIDLDLNQSILHPGLASP